MTPKVRRERALALTQIFREHDALSGSGDALVEHMGLLYRSGEELPTSDNLELWVLSWEDACDELDELQLPVRILRTGIGFLKSGGKDRATLLNLNQEERKILGQALSLDSTP